MQSKLILLSTATGKVQDDSFKELKTYSHETRHKENYGPG